MINNAGEPCSRKTAPLRDYSLHIFANVLTKQGGYSIINTFVGVQVKFCHTHNKICGYVRKNSATPTTIYAGMAELADAQDLGSCVNSCRFKSCYPYQRKGANAPFFVGTGNRLAESHRKFLLEFAIAPKCLSHFC